MDPDHHNLERFVVAQGPVYERVCAELAAGHKRSHWIWFIFPQLRGLGSSATARSYGIASLGEARAYLEHPVLGARLRQCAQLVNDVEGRALEEIFGYPDHLKFHSCMTLFARAADVGAGAQVFRDALTKYCAGEEDALTVRLLTAVSGT